jgi:nitrate/nitrite transporter NarK
MVMGLVNAFGNVGGYVGPSLIGWLSDKYHSTDMPFQLIGVGLLVAGGLSFLLPRQAKVQ